MSEARTVLVVAGFGSWVEGTPRVGKIETHIHPLATGADRVDFVCSGPRTDRTDDLRFYQVTPSRWRPLTILRQALLTVWLSLVGDYDLVASYSLIPYGIAALAAGTVSRTPVHLGIIGGDLDVHARRSYGPVVRWLFRRFDALSVAGERHRDELVDYGVDPSRLYVVLHPVSDHFAEVPAAPDPEYDLLWLTRMAPEKDPLLFVDTLDELRDRSLTGTAAIVGTGALEETVRQTVRERGLADAVDVPGWSADPVDYYRNAKVYVMTSEREMLPLTLVESMQAGVPPVVPPVGAIPEVVEDGRNGVLVDSRDPEAFADAIEPLLGDEARRREMGARAREIRTRTSEAAVARTWERILADVA